MEKDYLIPACSGMSIAVSKGQAITVIDVEGGQVADFFAEYVGDPGEFLSSAVTIDCNESLRLHVGDYIYTNLGIVSDWSVIHAQMAVYFADRMPE